MKSKKNKHNKLFVLLHFFSCRKLVQYCVLKGYLRRVRDYRISLDESAYMSGNESGNGHSNGSDSGKSKMQTTLRELCDGTNDSDSLACAGYCKYKF